MCIRDSSNQTGQMLAALLEWGQATFACGVEFAGEELKVNREVDGGTQSISVKLPAIITVDLRLNEPRYVKLPNIMKAKKKRIDVLTPEDLNVVVAPRVTVLKVVEPAARDAGVKVSSAAELVEKLRQEAKVI